MSDYQMALICGTPCVMDPLAVGREREDHHLGRVPDGIIFYFECEAAEDGYSVGDRVYWIDNDGSDWGYHADDEETTILCRDATPDYISDNATPQLAQMTAASWKAVAVPYIFEPTSVIGN